MTEPDAGPAGVPYTVGAQIEARAARSDTAERAFLLQGDRVWSYRRFRDESVRAAHFLLRRLGRSDDSRPGHVAMLLENHLELLALYGGCAYAGLWTKVCCRSSGQ